MRRKVPQCPNCQSKAVIPILYGMQSGQAGEEEKRGNLKLGGCEVSPGDPNWHCKDCGREWASEDTSAG